MEVHLMERLRVGARPDVVQVLVVDDQSPFRAAARAWEAADEPAWLGRLA